MKVVEYLKKLKSMKKSNYILLFTLFVTFNFMQAQEEKVSKFDIIAYGGIGYGIVESDNEPNYNLNNNHGEILLNYNVDDTFGFATGIGLNELTGNGFNSIGSFYHQRTVIKIPLLVTFNSDFSDKFKVFASLGVYGNNIIKDEYRFLNNTKKEVFEGWTFGLQMGAGFIFELSDHFGLGINLSGQSDFSKLESNINSGFTDEQKIKNLNSFGFIFMLKI
jgi:hypothetical protein